MKQAFLIIAVLIMIALLPFTPRILNLRIAVLRKLHLNWFAGLNERQFDYWVPVMRITMVAMIVILLILSLLN